MIAEAKKKAEAEFLAKAMQEDSSDDDNGDDEQDEDQM